MSQDTRQPDEGYVKYHAEHTRAPAPRHPLLAELDAARTELHDLGLVGIYANGIGFGNLSFRTKGNRFVISGTGTGAKRILGESGYCLVTAFDADKNRVECEGPIRASSEAMTHGAVYAENPRVQCVIHVHSRALFDSLLARGWPHTPENAAYGTPAMAMAIAELVRNTPEDQALFVLAGHDEGLVAYGPSIEKTMRLLIETVEGEGAKE